MKELTDLLEALGLEAREAEHYVVGELRSDDEIVRVYLSPEGEVRLERRRIEGDEVRPGAIAGYSGEYLRRVEVLEVFLTRDAENPVSLIADWLAGARPD